MRNLMGLSWDHSTGRRIVTLLLVLALAFSVVGILAGAASSDLDAASPAAAEVADGDMVVAGGSWSFKMMRLDPQGGGVNAYGASWS
jgi:hypothetical protein